MKNIFDECHVAVRICNCVGFIICFINGFIATNGRGGAFQVNSKALTSNNVVLQFRCRQVDVRDFINFCFFGEFISVEKFGVVKDPDFTILDLIAFTNMEFINSSIVVYSEFNRYPFGRDQGSNIYIYVRLFQK